MPNKAVEATGYRRLTADVPPSKRGCHMDLIEQEKQALSRRTTAIRVFALLGITCVAHALWYYPRLPEQVAHHFGASGQPDAWGSKTQFLITYLVAVGVMAATFLGLGLLMPKIPNWVNNLPNKDYWLAPERRKQTLDDFLAPYLWLGSLTMIVLLDIFHQSFQVHVGNATKLSHVWFTMGAYLILTAVWCVAVFRRFRRKA
jgi:uncharacterized membrane protein